MIGLMHETTSNHADVVQQSTQDLTVPDCSQMQATKHPCVSAAERDTHEGSQHHGHATDKFD